MAKKNLKSINSVVPIINSKSYFYQMHQENINVIFDWGIICPAGVNKEKKTKTDIQDKYKDYIFLTDVKKLFEEDNSQVLIEIVLFENDFISKTNIENVFLTNKPIPVSRIKRIFYSDKNYWEKLQNLIEADANSFVPFLIADFENEFDCDNLMEEINTEKIPIEDYSERLNLFDRRMGAIAFMKNADLYYGNYSNYSKHYIDILNVINPDVFKLSIHLENHEVFQKIMKTIDVTRFYKDVYEDKKITKEYLDDLIEEYSSKLKNGNELKLLKSKFGHPFSICKSEYLKVLGTEELIGYFRIAYVAIYGDKSHASTASSQLKNDFKNEVLDSDNADILLATLGMYYGYKSIRPHDSIEIDYNNELSNNIDKNQNIKFKLNTKLDYLTIESIYQISFDNQPVEIQAILSFAPSNVDQTSELKLLKKYSTNKRFKCENYRNYDVDFYRIIKKDLKKEITSEVENGYSAKIFAKDAIFSWIYRFFFSKGIIRISNEGLYVDKSDLIELLSQDVPSIDILYDLLEIDIRLNEESSNPYR